MTIDSVIPAKAGIPLFAHHSAYQRDPRFREGDGMGVPS